MTAAPFVVFGLPRSRTAWLSRFLTYGEWVCGHEEIRHVRSLDDVRAWFSQPCIGTVETAGAPWWRLLLDMQPNARVVTVRRSVEECVESLMRQNLPAERDELRCVLRRLNAKLDQIEARVPGVLSVRFHDLADESVCAQVFEHCLPYRHDPDWWRLMSPIDVQINLVALFRYAAAHRAQTEKIAAVARHASLAAMARRPAPELEGVVIGPERFDDFYRDGAALFDEHLVKVGEAPGRAGQKNIPLMRRLDEIGALQVVTARSNGRLFGYLMSVVGPSLEAEDRHVALQTTFYASPLFPGLGLRLQRAAVEALRAAGVADVLFRAGPRGDGPRMSTLYRRLGAEADGQMWRLGLEGV